jgi:hypothetical protein
MHVNGRGRSVAFTICLIAALAACSGDGGAKQCTVDEECASGARCTGGTCVVNRAPVASVAMPSGVEAFAVVTLDGSASSDPDAGDAVVHHAWTVTAVDAPCAPPIIAGTAATARARFGCAGRFAVELVAYDELGAASPPAAATIDVLPSTSPPLVTAPPDVPVGHRCGGDPVVCTLDTPDQHVVLAAAAAEPPPRVRWTVVPPALPAGGARQVTFDPSPDVLAPSVTIETDGSAISGDWIFRIEAFDELGVLGAAEMRVSVTNRPPVIEASMSPVPHAFDRDASRFTASGEIQVIWYDLDGDPLDRQLTSRAVSTGPGTFPVVDLGDRITFSIHVPYASPSDAAYLIGGAGLERSITMVLRDPNGGEARETWPVVVENRAPTLATVASSVAVSHQFDALTQSYRAQAALSRWTDPDGDPLFPVGPTGDVICPDLGITDDGTVTVACSLAYVGTPALANFAGVHTISTTARDPWSESDDRRATQVAIGNRAPGPVPVAVSVPSTCGLGACCIGSGAGCVDFYLKWSSATVRAEGFVTDPDGDPLTVTSSIASTICEPPACALDLRVASGQVCVVEPIGKAAYTASDGAATLSDELGVPIDCVY